MRRLAACALATLGVAGCAGDAATSKSGATVVVSVSGESLASTGYAFPPEGDEPAFVDGWQVAFERVLVTVDHVTLSEDPDVSPADPSRVGAVVARLDGPWAVDLHAGGPLEGKGGGADRALELGALSASGLDPERRYALGWSVVRASRAAKATNVGDAGKADYEEMIAKGYTALFVGTATFAGGGACTSSDPGYDFSKLPKVVKFRFGFSTPTTYVNCQNPDNDPAQGFAGEEHQRGVIVRPNQPTTAQLTLHTDHVFWDALQHDAPLHFDMIAARFASSVTLDDLRGVPLGPVRDAAGARVPWRSCVEPTDYRLPSGPMAFDTKGVGVSDLAGFMSYAESTMGHLNADGLCFVRRDD